MSRSDPARSGEAEPARGSQVSPLLTRRAALAGAGAGLLAPCCTALAQAPGPPSPERTARPKKGDRLVFAAGEQAGKPVTLAAMKDNGPQVMAWAADAESGAVRDGSRLNQILLVRLAEESLGEASRPRAAGGVVAYSASCTHALCPVSEWRKETGVLHCPCHGSEFDPRENGKVVNGPALRSLAALPLMLADNTLIVAGPFTGKIGMQA